MDLKKLTELVAADEEGAVITIYQRSGDPYLASDGTPCTVTVVGSESKRYRAAERNATKRLMKKRRATLEPEDVEAAQIGQTTAAVIDWHGWEMGGKPAPCTPENVRELLNIKHIREQVDAGVLGHADFFTGSSND